MTEPDRLTRLEAVVEGLAVSTTRLESTVDNLASKQGRWDWSAVGVMVGIGGGLIAFFFFGPVRNLEQSIDRSEKAAATNYDAVQAELLRLENRASDNSSRIWQAVVAEQQRNNDIGERLARVEEVDELYKAGMLTNPQRP